MEYPGLPEVCRFCTRRFHRTGASCGFLIRRIRVRLMASPRKTVRLSRGRGLFPPGNGLFLQGLRLPGSTPSGGSDSVDFGVDLHACLCGDCRLPPYKCSIFRVWTKNLVSGWENRSCLILISGLETEFCWEIISGWTQPDILHVEAWPCQRGFVDRNTLPAAAEGRGSVPDPRRPPRPLVLDGGCGWRIPDFFIVEDSYSIPFGSYRGEVSDRAQTRFAHSSPRRPQRL